MHYLKNTPFNNLVLSKTMPGHFMSQYRYEKKNSLLNYEVKCSKHAKSSIQDFII